MAEEKKLEVTLDSGQFEPVCYRPECRHRQSDHVVEEDVSYCLGGAGCTCRTFVPSPTDDNTSLSLWENRSELEAGVRLPPPFDFLVIGKFVKRTDDGGWLYGLVRSPRPQPQTPVEPEEAA